MKLETVLLAMGVLVMSGCGNLTGLGTTETERRICKEWFDSLPTASTQDTEQTKNEVADAAEIQRAVCGV